MNKILEFMSKRLPAWAIISLHGSLAFLAGWTAYNHYQLGNETGVSFWTMITCLWVGTGVIRLMGENHAGGN
jgi:hypothetical protein